MEFYFTMDKSNSTCFKAKVDRQEFHLRSSHIIKVHGVLDEGGHFYFDNVKTSIFLENNISMDDLEGTMLAQGTSFTTR